MGYIFIAIAALFILIGVLLKYFKSYWLISGYNLASEDKKKNVDVENLARFLGNWCFVMGVLFLVSAVTALTGHDALAAFVIVPILGITVYMLIGAQKYDKNNRNEDRSTKRSTKLVIGSVIAFITLVFSLVIGSMIYSTNKEHVVTIEAGLFKVNGIFGMEEKLENFTDISLSDEAPAVARRTNGLGIGDISRGSFEVQGMGTGKLYIHSKSKPFIYMRKGEGFVIVNFKDSAKTEELYKRLMKNWKK